MKQENEALIRFPSLSANEAFARSVTAAFAAQLDPTLDELGDLKTAVSEAVTNAIVHAYPDRIGPVTLRLRRLPDNVLEEGKAIVKSRFRTVAAFFAVTSVIKGIFNQIGRGLTEAGKAIGGDTGSTVGSAVSSVIQVIVSYLCDCCLGWVFYRSKEKSAKATCEGAVLFFKHGKTLAKNLGRVFGIGLASLVVIGGAFTGIFYLIASQFPQVFSSLFNSIRDVAIRNNGTIPSWLSDPTILTIAISAIAGLIVWDIIHSAFIRPFTLVGVLRNYIQSGINDIPTEEAFAVLDGKSAKFKKLHQEAA